MGLLTSLWQNEANKAEAKRAYERDVDMWNRMNQYNAPKMQMKRYQEAGLNPNMIYGQGTPGNATQLPKYQKPNMEVKDVETPDALNILANTRLLNAQAQKTEAETKLIGEKTLTEPLTRFYQEVRGQLSNAQLVDLRNFLTTKWGWKPGMKQGEYSLKGTPGQRDVLNKTQQEANKADIGLSEATMKAEMVKWLKANNLTKWIPLLGLVFKYGAE